MTHSTLRTAIVGFVLCVAASTTACSSNSGKDIVTQGSDVVTTQGDGSITVEQLISALQGGTLEIPGGARLEIPPGALAEDTTVSVTVPTDQKASTSHVIFLLEPQGLTFKVPALLTFPYLEVDGAQPMIKVYQSSTLNPLLDLGTERTDWALAEVENRDVVANELTIALEHFTFVYATVSVDDYAYLVLDMPPKYLKAGDIVFVLTSTEDDPPKPCWAPGHPGIFEGLTSYGYYSVIEATPPKVRRLKFRGEDKKNPGQEDMALRPFTFKGEYGHLYLGPRRPGTPLSDEQRQDAITWARNQIDAEYSMLGQGNLTNGSFSCVGLCESALDSVDAGVLDWRNEALAQTPLEMYRATRPVNELTEDVLVDIDIPIYGVTVHPDSPAWGLVFRGWYQRDVDYVITATDLPPGATFTGTPKSDFHLKWTPQREHAGQTFTVLLQMTATPRVVDLDGDEEYLPTQEIYETLTIHVRPLPTDLCEQKECGPDGFGGSCGECISGQECVDGKCLCTAASCGQGCCDGNQCRSGDSDDLCGGGGGDCADCESDFLACIDRTCKCTKASCGGC